MCQRTVPSAPGSSPSHEAGRCNESGPSVPAAASACVPRAAASSASARRACRRHRERRMVMRGDVGVSCCIIQATDRHEGTMTDLRKRCHSGVTWVLALLAPTCGVAGVIDAINVVRDVGCDGHPGGVAPLHENARLNEVAHRLSQGTKLQQAQESAGYHAVSSFAVNISNVPPSGDVESIVSRQFCQQTTNPAFTEIGTWWHGSDVWIALAEPFAPPAPHDLG